MMLITCFNASKVFSQNAKVGIYSGICDLQEPKGVQFEIFNIRNPDSSPKIISLSQAEFEEIITEYLTDINHSEYTRILIQSIVRKDHVLCIKGINANEELELSKFNGLINFMNEELMVQAGTFYERGSVHCYINTIVELSEGHVESIEHQSYYFN